MPTNKDVQGEQSTAYERVRAPPDYARTPLTKNQGMARVHSIQYQILVTRDNDITGTQTYEHACLAHFRIPSLSIGGLRVCSV